MRLYNRADIERECDEGAFRRGLGYFRQGRVSKVKISAGGKIIKGRVRGNYASSYSQDISISEFGGQTAIDGDCTCPVGFNCKHVVAVLLQGLREPLSPVSTAAPSSGKPGLDPKVKYWLDGLEQAVSPPDGADPNAYPDDIRQRLIYVLAPSDAVGPIDFLPAGLRIFSTRQLKKGGYSKNVSTYDPENVLNYRPAKYLRPIDLEILRHLYWARRSDPHVGISGLHDLSRITDGAVLLEKIIGTGRCHYGGLKGPRLSLGPKRRGKFIWRTRKDGAQKAGVRLSPADGEENAPGEQENFVHVLPLVPAYYLDPAKGLCGVLDTGLEPVLAAQLAKAPPLSMQDAALVRQKLEKMLPGEAETAIPLPEAPANIETRQIAPKPVLRLISGDLEYDPDYFRMHRYYYRPRFEKITLPLARLAFDYNGHEIASDSPEDVIEHKQGDTLFLIPRDRTAENLARRVLDEQGFERIEDTGLFSSRTRHQDDFFLMPLDDDGLPPKRPSEELYFHDSTRFIRLSTDVLPALIKDKGWRVEVAADYPYRIAEGETQWWGDVGEGSGIDWFSFSVGVEFEGEQINLLPALMEVIGRLPDDFPGAEDIETRDELLEEIFHENAVLWHRLDDGRLLPLPGPRLLPIVRILLDLYGGGKGFSRLEDGLLRLSPLDATALTELEETCADVRWHGHERARELGNMLLKAARNGFAKNSATAWIARRPAALSAGRSQLARLLAQGRFGWRAGR